ncbi:MAG: hypothetical protein N3A57_05905, partial [Negativicutes bacterium]|nr:hypothetical protein [Negativicutes bacterium]
DEIDQFIAEAWLDRPVRQMVRQQIGPARYDVTAYQMVYTSVDHLEREVPVSGAVLVPAVPDQPALPLLIFLHATIFDNRSAPSNVDSSAQARAAMAVFAAAGYIVVMPDYIGSGLVTGVPDEYLYSRTAAANGLDTIVAARQLLVRLAVSTSGRLFVAGYSEGGAAASALGRLLQAHCRQYRVTALAMMAGPYDMAATVRHLLDAPGGVRIGPLPVGSMICARAVQAWNRIYRWDSSGDIFRPPYRQRVAGDFARPDLPFWHFLLYYPAVTRQLFSDEFLARAAAGPVADDIAANSTDDWLPEMPTAIICSDGDTLIPPAVARATYDKMKAGGGRVTLLTAVYPRDHLDDFWPALALARTFFDPMAGLAGQ